MSPRPAIERSGWYREASGAFRLDLWPQAGRDDDRRDYLVVWPIPGLHAEGTDGWVGALVLGGHRELEIAVRSTPEEAEIALCVQVHALLDAWLIAVITGANS